MSIQYKNLMESWISAIKDSYKYMQKEFTLMRKSQENNSNTILAKLILKSYHVFRVDHFEIVEYFPK